MAVGYGGRRRSPAQDSRCTACPDERNQVPFSSHSSQQQANATQAGGSYPGSSLRNQQGAAAEARVDKNHTQNVSRNNKSCPGYYSNQKYKKVEKPFMDEDIEENEDEANDVEESWADEAWDETDYSNLSLQSDIQCPGGKLALDDFEEVEQLIQEEGDDFQTAQHLQQQKERASQPLPSNSSFNGNRPLQHKMSPYKYEESDDEVSPEVAAAMMHSEEQGILMGAAPLRVYNALFSDNEKDLIAVTSAAPFHPQNVVVPADVRKMPFTTSAEDLVALASSIHGMESVLSSHTFCDAMKHRGLYLSVLEGASRGYNNEAKETGSFESASKMSLLPGVIEYMLDPASPPDHYSRIQLRGTRSPEWFAGYFEALPDIDGITAVCHDPSTVLEDAWWTLQTTLA